MYPTVQNKNIFFVLDSKRKNIWDGHEVQMQIVDWLDL